MKEGTMEEKTFCQLFEEQVERTPDAIALTFQNVRLSYKELNGKVNQLAHYLREKGVGPETLVGISTERSIDMVLGLLATLKAGGAYIPLDPNYPKNRISFMLEDTQAPILITQGALSHKFLEYKGHIIKIDEDWDKIDKKEKINPIPLGVLKNLAYIIYTSGSTGQPKGVMIEHRSLSNFLISLSLKTAINNQDKLLAVTTPSFDIAGLEIYLPLIVGAQAVIACKEAVSNGEKLIELMSTEQISLMQATPSTWQMVIEAGWKVSKNIRILSGGEALSESLAAHLLKRCKRLWNVYGPTETTIWSTIAPVSKGGKRITIGKPIENTQVYILDKDLNPVSKGEIGEIYIGGKGVGRGYFNYPKFTAERFIPNPFGEEKNEEDRLYQTGDLGKYGEDENIEFLGRIDNQVKIRGYRIELAEIEAIIKTHPMIKEITVVPQENKSSEKFLTAFFSRYKEIPIKNRKKENINSWANIYEEIYEAPLKINDPTFNTAGWRDSYSGNLIPEVEIRELVNNTIERILSLKPSNVLEIGCGTGLLLFPLAPLCKKYWGTDISLQGISYIKNIVKNNHHFQNIELQHKSAEKINELNNQYFDTIIINSVIQYFPNIQYLTDVIEKSINLLRETGKIFIGDIRNLDLLQEFHASKCFKLMPSNTSCKTFKAKLLESMTNEDQLLISPSFFRGLKSKFPQIKHIQIQPRRGVHSNELILFRYDAILHINTSLPIRKVNWLQWNQEWSLNKIKEHIKLKQPEILAFRNIPNKRLIELTKKLELINNSYPQQYISSVYSSLEFQSSCSLDPEEVHIFSKEAEYECEVSWYNSYKGGAYDLFFKSRKHSTQSFYDFERSVNTKEETTTNYGNQPKIKDKNIILSLKKILNKHLPSYMTPSNFVELEKFPYLPNGKIDRKTLSELEVRPVKTSSESYLAPRTELERSLSDVWSDVLNIENIGVNDNFFQIGGDSIRCVQLAVRLREKGINISVSHIFSYPTISQLAEQVTDNSAILDIGMNFSEERKTIPSPLENFKDKNIIQDLKLFHPSKTYPLSPFQQTVAYFLRSNPHSNAYFNQALFELRGNINQALLKKAWIYVLKKYPILRTYFPYTRDGTHIQKTKNKVKLPWRTYDWSNYNENKVLSNISSFISKDRNEGFNITEAPLWRIHFIRVSRNRHFIILIFHNLILDGWSASQIREDVALIYDKLKNKESVIDSEQTSYIKYIKWLEHQDTNKAKSFWKNYLRDVDLSPNFISLPQREITSKNSETYSFHDFKLSLKETSSLLKLAQQYKVTLNSLIQSAWTLFLNYYTGKEDVVYGITVSGRSIDLEDVSEIVGVLINTIPVRIKLSLSDTVCSVFKEIHQLNPLLHQYSYIPIKTIEEWTRISVKQPNHILFDNEFVFNNLPASQYRSKGKIKIENAFEYEKTATPIMINIFPHDRLSVRINYYEKYFHRNTIKEIEKVLRIIINLIMHFPEMHIKNIKEKIENKEYKIIA